MAQTDLRVGTTAAHGSAEEDVHQQHDEEEHTQRDGQPQQPAGPDAVLAIG